MSPSLAAGLVFLGLLALAGGRGFRQGRAGLLRLGRRLLLGSGLLLLGLLLSWLCGALWALGLLLLPSLWLKLRSHRQADEQGPTTEHPAWRYAGLLVATLLVCLGCVYGGLLIETLATQTPAPQTVDRWAGVRAFGAELGDLGQSLLGEVPVLGEQSEDLRALVRILNTDHAILAAYAQRHGLGNLSEAPAVRAALADPALLADLRALGEADLLAIERLLRSPHLPALLDDPQLRAVADQIDLRVMADELAAEEAASRSLIAMVGNVFSQTWAKGQPQEQRENEPFASDAEFTGAGKPVGVGRDRRP